MTNSNRRELIAVGSDFHCREAQFNPTTGSLTTSEGTYKLRKHRGLANWWGMCNCYSVTLNQLPSGNWLMEWW